jgi:hypothetical protein
MSTREEITPEEYYEKWQEEANTITTELNLTPILVVSYSDDDLRDGKISACVRLGTESGLQILNEAQERIDKKYILKSKK